jgi:hypothetical protein
MSHYRLLAAIATMVIIGAHHASAADLGISTRSSDVSVYTAPRSHKVIRHARRHVVVYRHRFVAWKRVGMMCRLTPDVIVRYNWNGPQCRWVDNM